MWQSLMSLLLYEVVSWMETDPEDFFRQFLAQCPEALLLQERNALADISPAFALHSAPPASDTPGGWKTPFQP